MTRKVARSIAQVLEEQVERSGSAANEHAETHFTVNKRRRHAIEDERERNSAIALATMFFVNNPSQDDATHGRARYDHDAPSRCWSIDTHDAASLPSQSCNIEMVEQYSVVEAEEELKWPALTFSSALKPLEVRVNLGSESSHHLMVAASVKPVGGLFEEDFHAYESASQPISVVEGRDYISDQSSQGLEWPIFPSQCSTINIDDFSDSDVLSQISAFYS